MDITPETRTITTYTLKLTDIDAAELLSDPYSFSERLRDSLLPHVPQQGGVSAHKPGKASQFTIGRASGKRKAAGKATKAPKGVKGTGLVKVACPVCGKQVAAKFLPLHQAKKHAASSPAASAAPSSSTE